MLLISELWEELAREDMELPLTRDQIAELDRRMAHYRQHPDEVTTFAQIKAKLHATKANE